METTRITRLFPIVLGAWALVIGAWWAYINFGGGKDVAFTSPGPIWHAYWFNVVYGLVFPLLALPLSLGVARSFGGWSSRIGRGALLLAIASVMWGLGSAIWFGYNVSGEEAPYPSWADAGFISLLPFACLGLLNLRYLLGIRGRDLAKSSWILILVCIITGYYGLPSTDIGGFTYGHGYLIDPKATNAANITSAFYLTTDTILGWLALTLLIHARNAAGGQFLLPMLSTAAAFVTYYFGDFFFVRRVYQETYFNGDMADALYALALWLMSASIWLLYRAYTRQMRELASPPQ